MMIPFFLGWVGLGFFFVYMESLLGHGLLYTSVNFYEFLSKFNLYALTTRNHGIDEDN